MKTHTRTIKNTLYYAMMEEKKGKKLLYLTSAAYTAHVGWSSMFFTISI